MKAPIVVGAAVGAVPGPTLFDGVFGNDLGGAVLMSVVVLKQFVVELGNTGTVARVVSFLGVGVLLVIVGYFAPVPPRSGTQPAAS